MDFTSVEAYATQHPRAARSLHLIHAQNKAMLIRPTSRNCVRVLELRFKKPTAKSSFNQMRLWIFLACSTGGFIKSNW